jgi:phosphohistidine phosphatase
MIIAACPIASKNKQEHRHYYELYSYKVRMITMVSNIMFFRHGKAQDKDSSKPDSQRHLTQSGIEKLKAEMSGFVLLLPKSQNMQTWASPLSRSLETAEIINSYLKTEIIVFDFISTGDYDELINRLHSSTCNTVIIVGHEPWLGNWTNNMTKCPLPYKKGSCALIKPDASFSRFDIAWFVQPETLLNLKLNQKGGFL